jgi:hypothetical protein
MQPEDPLREGVTILAEHECWRLLRESEVGRLAVAVGSQADIFPINYLVDHGTILFRTAEGTKLAAAVASVGVAFEVDGYDPAAGEAWSVVLHGAAQEVQGLHEQLDVEGLPLFPWHAAPKHRFVRIVPSELSGRRFRVIPSARWRSPLTGIPRAAPE